METVLSFLSMCFDVMFKLLKGLLFSVLMICMLEGA